MLHYASTHRHPGLCIHHRVVKLAAAAVGRPHAEHLPASLGQGLVPAVAPACNASGARLLSFTCCKPQGACCKLQGGMLQAGRQSQQFTFSPVIWHHKSRH
jgi:hypothetical protein